MITAVRTFTIHAGAQQEAISTLNKIVGYIKENYSRENHIERNISGSIHTIHLVGEHESLAAYDSGRQKLLADEKVMKPYSDFVKTYVSEQNLLLLERVS